MDNYLRTINIVQKCDRRCHASEKEAIESGNVLRQEELEALTHSQTVLLKSEYDYLRRDAMTNKSN